PVASPSLAVVRRSKQTFDEPLPSAWCAVVEKLRGLGRGGRQTDQIQIGPANERRATRWRRGLDPLRCKLLAHKCVDRITFSWRRVVRRLAESPVVADVGSSLRNQRLHRTIPDRA